MSARPRLAVPVALGVVLAGSLLTAGSAAAGTPAMGANATLGLPCLSLEVMGTVPVTIKQKRGATIIAQRTFVPADDGRDVCLKTLKAGDKLLIHQGLVDRQATVPTFSASQDFATDRVAGTTSLVGETVVVSVVEQLAGFSTGNSASWNVGPVAGVGSFGVTTTGQVDLERGDRVSLNILTDTDEWFRELRSGSIAIRAGQATASGTVTVGKRAIAVLKSPKGVVRGKFNVASGRDRNTAGAFSGTFRKNGKAVKVKPGDRITFSGSPAGYVVPKPNLDVDPTGNGSLRARCPAGGQWIVFVGQLRVDFNTTPGDGTVIVSDLQTVSSGERVKLVCSNKTGWVTVQEVVVP